ncbi:DUF2306 domain-containing protein [Actinophytocola sediminis]
MTQDVQQAPRLGEGPDDPRGTVHTRSAPPRWWRRPWVIPLALVVLGFLIYQLSPFRELNEATAPLPPHEGAAWYWPTLLIHMVFGTIAMITVVLQLWPWLRRNHRRVHRISGRFYVVSTLISGVCALSIVSFAPPVGRIGVSMATTLWMFTTTMAYIRVRQHRYAAHRRFMLYSFAIVMNNVWGVVIVQTGMHLPTEQPANFLVLIEAARWVGWVVNLMLVQWWLYHTENRPEFVDRVRPKTKTGR